MCGSSTTSARVTRLPEDVTFARGDINDLPRLWTLLQGVDCVYHLAARVSVPESVRYPREYNSVNVGGTVSVLEAMRDVGVKRLVFASSGAVYGDQSEQPLHEALPPNPLSPYAVSKLASEHYIHTIGRLWNVGRSACASSRLWSGQYSGRASAGRPAVYPPGAAQGFAGDPR